MATLKVEIVEVKITEHPDADALEIAHIRGYQSIVRKGQFEDGDLAVYIPEQSIVPEWLIRRLNLWDDEKGKGKLAGSNGDRVKVIKLRGVTSQGLIYPLQFVLEGERGKWLMDDNHLVKSEVVEGEDVTEKLGIVKWEPPIPVAMAGEVVALAGKTLSFDVENVKNYPHIVQALIDLQVPVQLTEKLHGTWCCFGFYPTHINDEIPYGRVVVTSKGLSGKGLAFKDNEANTNNLYMRTFKKYFPNFEALDRYGMIPHKNHDKPLFILGEIFGKGIQDLEYGLTDTEFAVFDVYQGTPGSGEYLPPSNVNEPCGILDYLPFKHVPILYEGPLTWAILKEYTDGNDTITGSHMREGVIIRPVNSVFRNHEIGRVILKSVSDNYLNRKDGTEYN